MKAKLDTLKERLNVKVFELKEKDEKIIKLTREAEVAAEVTAYYPLDEKFARREIFIPMGMRNKLLCNNKPL